MTAAALLHDVGKVESSFGTVARAVITFVGIAVGRTRLLAWAGRQRDKGRRSARARVGLYLTHDRIGAELLRARRKPPLDGLLGRRASPGGRAMDHRPRRECRAQGC